MTNLACIFCGPIKADTNDKVARHFRTETHKSQKRLAMKRREEQPRLRPRRTRKVAVDG